MSEPDRPAGVPDAETITSQEELEQAVGEKLRGPVAYCRPSVVTGITPDGWKHLRAGDVMIETYESDDGRRFFLARPA
ncbi:hypothetical protein [Actinocorallia longicatena]|uniref:Uncharacterized protein n=1 Tax=Actinocorallia longicatena TaxID=111803 RepID=A0ABP6QE09_9ACTN